LAHRAAVLEYLPRHQKTAFDISFAAGHQVRLRIDKNGASPSSRIVWRVQKVVDFLVYTYKIQCEARELFIKIACHDFKGIKDTIRVGNRYRFDQTVIFVKEKEALEVRKRTLFLISREDAD
jgi:hypothetical protein